MQAAKEDERKRKKEQKMAERFAQMEANSAKDVKEEELDTVPIIAKAGRILDEVEKQEEKAADLKETEKNIKTEKGLIDEKRKKKKEKDSPMLITLKPFYRPDKKNGFKKKKLTEQSEGADEDDEEFTPRSPVPLPDSAGLKPVLIKPYLTKMPAGSPCRKSVKYADGVLPGQGSPDQSWGPGHPRYTEPSPPAQPPPPRKKYKKVRITVITQHSGDTDSEEEPPPPPPGSPIRYTLTLSPFFFYLGLMKLNGINNVIFFVQVPFEGFSLAVWKKIGSHST